MDLLNHQWLQTQEKNNKNKAKLRSREQEKQVAKDLSGRITPGSGCGNLKGDVRVRGSYRIECKNTQKNSYSLKRSEIEKIEDQAVTYSETGIMIIRFNKNEEHNTDKQVVILDYEEFKRLINEHS
jgi:hypothetical protein